MIVLVGFVIEIKVLAVIIKINVGLSAGGMAMHHKKIKLLALLCVFQILISFSGCFSNKVSPNKQDPSEQVKLRILTCGGSNQEACKRISKDLSDITLKRYGFTVKLEQVSLSEYSSIINREQMLSRTPDLFVYCSQNDLAGYVEKNMVLNLNNLLETEGSSLLSQINKDIWSTSTLFNTIYAVPAVNGASYSLGFIARKDIVDALQVKSSDVKDLDSLYNLLKHVKKQYKDITPVVPHFGEVIPTLGEDPLGDGLGVLLDGSKTTVENLYSSNIYYDVSKRLHQWYGEGLILENASSYAESYSTLIKAFNGFGFFIRFNEYTVTSASKAIGKEMVAFCLSNPVLNTSNYNLGWCVSSVTPYPKQAMQMLNLLYNDKEVSDLCIYGQKGVDYSRLDANTVSAPKKENINLWNSIAWAWPNRSIASNWKQGSLDGRPDKVPDNINISKAMGFVFDSSPVQNAVDQCISIVNKYNNAILCGYLDPDEAIPIFLQELKEAGIDSVIANKKYQLNIWLANKIK